MVEDYVDLSTLLSRHLAHQHVVDVATDLTQAQFHLDTTDYNLLLLDLALPDGNGYDFYSQQELTQRPPVLFLTAETSLSQKIKCLQAGRADYLAKPFSLSELDARIERLLTQELTGLSPTRPTHLLVAGELSLDTRSHLVCLAGQAVYLNRKEFLLLKLFLENQNRLLSQELIVEQVWPDETALFGNSLPTVVASLRRKLGKDHITTIKGRGYLLRSR